MAELRRTYKEQEIYDAWVEREAAKARLKKRFEEEAVRFAEEDALPTALPATPPLKQAA